MATSEAAAETLTPAPRPAIDALPVYRPGRNASDALADHGVADAIKLASNESPWPPVAAVVAAYRLAEADLRRYPDARAGALRAALARHHGVDPDQVAVGPGAVGLLQQLAITFVRPGDPVVRGEPSFEAYPIFTRLAGGVDVAVPAVAHRLDLAGMAGAVTPTTRLVLVAEPNNPTSTAASGPGLTAFVDAVAAAGPGCLTVLDGAYHEFTDDPGYDEAMALAATRPGVLALRTFSKAHGLAALRVGYAVGHPAVIAAIDKALIPFAVSGPAQAAALAALAATDQIAPRLAAVRAERERVREALVGLGLDVPPSRTNFVWLPLGDDAARVAAELERAGVVTRAFPGLGVRVTVGTVEEDDRFLAAATAALGR